MLERKLIDMETESSTAESKQVVALDPRDLELVRSIFQRNGVSDHNRPVIFGSRATGTARRYSDLDIGFAGEPLPASQLMTIRDELEESRLPINVDVLNFTQASEQLREHALENAVPLKLAVGVQP